MVLDLLEKEKKILKEIKLLSSQLKEASEEEKIFFKHAIVAEISKLRAINAEIVVSKIQKFPVLAEKRKEKREGREEEREEREKIKKIKKIKEAKIEKEKAKTRKPSGYVSISSKFFLGPATKIVEKFNISSGVKKARIRYLPSMYVAIALFTILLCFFLALFISVFLTFFEVGFFSLEIAKADFPRFAKLFSFSLLLPFAAAFLFFFYPFAQKSALRSKIDNELPFVAINMSAVASSGVEPSTIFKIIARSEYRENAKEMKKLLNMLNIYGYDVVSALREVAKTTASEKLASLLNGIATNLVGGGNLSDYLEKKSSDMLLDYRLERRRYATAAETSLDLYVGILIAAPLMIMMLLVLMGIIGMSPGLTTSTLAFLIISGIALLNIIFLLFIHFRAPK